MGQRASTAEPPRPPPSSSSSHHTVMSKNSPIELSSSSENEHEDEEHKPPPPHNPKNPNISDLLEEAQSTAGVTVDWSSLFPPRPRPPADLDSPFSEHEIFLALFDPSDDPPLCFFQAFWCFLKPDLLSLFDDLYRCSARALRTRFAAWGGTFCLVRRVLAARLRSHLHLRVRKGHFILDSVASAKSVFDSCRTDPRRALFILLQFEKAFGTIAWDFVLQALRSRGLGLRWAAWVELSLFSRMDTERRKGLMDGDPLSSCLFLIAVEAFASMLWKGRFAGLVRGTGNLVWTNDLKSLHYTRDALVLVPPDRGSLINLKLFLYFFELVSGLCINFDRSCAYSLSGDDTVSVVAAGILNCRVGKFPFIYLGMVVTYIKLSVVEDDDCYILDEDPYDTTADELKKKISHYEDCEKEEEEISILAEKGPVACRDYPHPRHLCANYPFNKTAHESYCPQCYCYVCDVVAPCAYWTGGSTAHCDASDKMVIWSILRNSRRSPASS